MIEPSPLDSTVTTVQFNCPIYVARYLVEEARRLYFDHNYRTIHWGIYSVARVDVVYCCHCRREVCRVANLYDRFGGLIAWYCTLCFYTIRIGNVNARDSYNEYCWIGL